jgi:hypothetical protein
MSLTRRCCSLIAARSERYSMQVDGTELLSSGALFEYVYLLVKLYRMKLRVVIDRVWSSPCLPPQTKCFVDSSLLHRQQSKLNPMIEVLLFCFIDTIILICPIPLALCLALSGQCTVVKVFPTNNLASFFHETKRWNFFGNYGSDNLATNSEICDESKPHHSVYHQRWPMELFTNKFAIN